MMMMMMIIIIIITIAYETTILMLHQFYFPAVGCGVGKVCTPC